jgi:hypothetical protein
MLIGFSPGANISWRPSGDHGHGDRVRHEAICRATGATSASSRASCPAMASRTPERSPPRSPSRTAASRSSASSPCCRWSPTRASCLPRSAAPSASRWTRDRLVQPSPRFVAGTAAWGPWCACRPGAPSRTPPADRQRRVARAFRSRRRLALVARSGQGTTRRTRHAAWVRFAVLEGLTRLLGTRKRVPVGGASSSTAARTDGASRAPAPELFALMRWREQQAQPAAPTGGPGTPARQDKRVRSCARVRGSGNCQAGSSGPCAAADVLPR